MQILTVTLQSITVMQTGISTTGLGNDTHYYTPVTIQVDKDNKTKHMNVHALTNITADHQR